MQLHSRAHMISKGRKNRWAVTFRARTSLSRSSLPNHQVSWGIHVGSMFGHEGTPRWRSVCSGFTSGIKLAGFARTSRDPDANTRHQPLLLKYIVKSPDAWQNPPRVHRLMPDRREHSLTGPIEFKAGDFQREYVVISWQRAIVLKTRTGQVVQPLEELDKAQHALKPARAGPPCSPRFLYHEMIGSAERSSRYVN